MRKFFAIKGIHDAERILDINSKAHVVTKQGTFKMRDNMHSNTFLVGTDLVKKIYDLSPIDYNDVYESLESWPMHDVEHIGSALMCLDDVLSRAEIDTLKKNFYLVEKDGRLGRLEYTDIIKTLQYIQSLGDMGEFCLYGGEIKEWAMVNFGKASNRNISLELGLFILLRRTRSCSDLGSFDGFLDEWRRHDLEEPDLGQFLVYLDRTFLRKEARMKIKGSLGRLI